MSTCPKLLSACLLIALSNFCQADDDAPHTAYAEEARAIVQAIESRRPALDATYDFSRLARAGLLPPILDNPNPGPQLPCVVEPCRIRKPATPYCKGKAPHGSADCDAVSWRDYLFKGLADADPSLTSRDALMRFVVNLAELQADFLGMSLYVSFEARGLVKPSSTDLRP